MPMRIGGLASGMDIDSMVKDLMKVERMPLDKLEQEKQILEWKQEDYRSINTLLLDFRSELTQMNMSSTYRSRTVSTSDESKVTATASGAATLSSYNISNVTQLATAATLTNEKGISTTDDQKIDVRKGLYSQENILQPDGMWKKGIIETQNLSATKTDEEKNSIEFNADISELNSMSIRVDGKGFEVVLEEDLAENGPLKDHQVLYKQGNDEESGSLTFNEGILQENTRVRAQYIVENQTESRTIDEPMERWQLKKGSIATDDNFSLNINDVEYKLDLTSEDNGEYNLVEKDGETVIGTINAETGLITFDNEVFNEDLVSEGTNIEATYQQNYTDFSLGAHTSEGLTHETFLVAGNTSLNSLMSTVNSSNVGLTMFYDSFTDQMTLTRNETGNFNGNGYNGLEDGETPDKEILTSGSLINDVFRFGEGKETGGDNIKFTFNNLETERHSNTFDISGVTFSVKQTFTDDAGVTLSVNNDSDAVFENIKEFVEKYNTLIDTINKEINEDVHRDYKPLTDAEREELTDKQAEKWEDMARSGLLKGDATLSGALSSFRSDFYNPVNNSEVSGMYNQLASIGITTTSNYLDGGKLEINEAKLKAAIEDDPKSVENLFRGEGDSHAEQGISRRLYDTVNSTMDKIYERAGRASYSNHQFTLGRQLEDVEDRIDQFQNRLTQVEDRYWRQFTAMEKAIQQSNSQMNYLYQQFGM